MKLKKFLKSKILFDLHDLFKGYMEDTDSTTSDKDYWKERQNTLKKMSLDELINANLEFVTDKELASFMKEYIEEWFGTYKCGNVLGGAING